MIRPVHLRLQDIDDNIRVILARIQKSTLDDLRRDIDLRYTVHHALMIIAEAVRHLPPEAIAAHPGISWSKIVGIGNKIKHEYHRADPVVVWIAVTEHMRPLHVVIKKMLADQDQPALPL